MVVEHAFVTTLEAPDALGAARDLLLSRGWRITEETSLFIEAANGEKNSVKAKSVHTLPQAIRAEFDRGRVTLGASITPRRGAKAEHSEYLFVIVRALEEHISNADPNCCVRWDELNAIYNAQRRKRKRRQVIAICTILGIFAVFIVLLIVAISNSHV